MTFENLEDYIVTAVGVSVAGLLGLVRKSDSNRIKSLEDKQERQDEHFTTEIHGLRNEMRDNHNQLVALIVNK
jgi:hypothetical protein